VTSGLFEAGLIGHTLVAVSPAPSPALCLETLKLIKALEWAVSEYNRMNPAQIAVLGEEEGLLCAEHIAQPGRLDNAKYALMAHKEKRGC
jgi:hypothetical protein